MNKTENILTNNKCLKLICGAGNENADEVEKLAYVYSLAGFNMIDVSPNKSIIAAAKSGLKKANKENSCLICVSVGLNDDIHFSKAVINEQKCVSCSKCLNICPQDAIYIENNYVKVDLKKCIGCSKCIKLCPNNAIIKESKSSSPSSILNSVLSEDIDCVEFHCSISNKNQIIESFNELKKIYDGVFSICLNRAKLCDEDIIDLLHNLILDDKFVIFQADGNPMTGGADDYKSTLQCIAFADVIRNSKLPLYLILSGGTNSLTSKFAKECNLNIDGVALGSFARKLVKEYIHNENFYNKKELQNQAVIKAKELANKIKMYF